VKLKALIVDDEYPARQELRNLLASFTDVEVVGEATNAPEALQLTKALEHDILFLDIQMPGLNGLQMARELQQLPNPPCVIFTTAYEEYAVEAFEVSALDYLLKPFDEVRLARALEKVRRVIGNRGKSPGRPANAPGIERINRIPVEKWDKTVLINQDDIVYAYTEDDYVYIKLFNDKLLTRYTLKDLESRLASGGFFRTHRQYLVNLRKVREILPYFKGAFTLVVEDAQRTEIPVSRANVKKLKKLLGM